MLDGKELKAQSTKQKAWSISFKLFAFCFLLFAFFLSGCKDEFNKTDSGLEYKFVHQTKGKEPKHGEYLIFDLLMKTGTDSVIYSTTSAGVLFPIRYDTYKLKVGQKNAIEEGFFMMHEGDSAVFSVKASDVYAALNVSQSTATNDRIYCYAKLVSILDYEHYSNWKSVQLARRQNENALEIKRTMQKETYEIDSFLNARHEAFAVAASGIRYSIEKQGTGSFPRDGDSVFFKYEVSYLDGTTPPERLGKSGDKPAAFIIGSRRVFESWNESVQLLKKGGSGKFYIPSPLASEASGNSGVKPGAILIINIQLVDIKTNNMTTPVK
jgi:FKBP-type peptidyl-prolyl cis-trans isomerase FkpA